MAKNLVLTTDLPIGKKSIGKVRDIYDLGDYLLIVTTDRISAFDVVLPNGIPLKGKTLNKLSVLWFKKLAHIIRNHFITDNVKKYPSICKPYAKLLRGRSMLVKKATPLPVECIVRGYISGSGWKSYKNDRTVCGLTLLPGLVESDRLDEPIFTPTTKAESGHDMPISFKEMCDLIGEELALKVRDVSLSLYIKAAKVAEQAGIIIADTKFEYGLSENNKLMLIDEALTPDSSRFWPLDLYTPGGPQPSFDKQFVRDYLLSIDWEGKTPAPKLPQEVIDKTSEKYFEAYEKLLSVLK
ncbi:MAG: phosphoribosylaminoimidazolesuccinocarboxamide synthase [Patescibacteria group bacterium]|jgi:phosphoribosylaminoimidazole-succinocarboxamide synthase